jgi:hypothetical protein
MIELAFAGTVAFGWLGIRTLAAVALLNFLGVSTVLSDPVSNWWAGPDKPGRVHRLLGVPSAGQRWADNRPIGQLILADWHKFTPTNPNGWQLTGGGPKDIGLTTWQSKMLAIARNSARNIINAGGQGVIVWDIAGICQTPGNHGSEQYIGDPRVLDPVGAGLTQPGSITYVPPDNYLVTNPGGPAPEMNEIADKFMQIFKTVGLKVGVALRAQHLNIDSGSHGLTGGDELAYDTVPHLLADLDAKLTYAYNRWGCRLFYVDSNVAPADVSDALAMQGNARYAPAHVYTQLHARHPDCLICPEELIYSSTFFFPALGINDPPYQYLRVCQPYQELRLKPAGQAFLDVDPDVLLAVPGAWFLINCSEGNGYTAAQLFNLYNDRLINVVKQGGILMFMCWWNSPETALVKQVYLKARSASRTLRSTPQNLRVVPGP